MICPVDALCAATTMDLGDHFRFVMTTVEKNLGGDQPEMDGCRIHIDAYCGAAKKEIMPGVEHRQHKGLNNRAENSRQPTRRRERQMKRFKSARHAQRFLSAHDPINNLFLLPRHRMPATEYRAERTRAFQAWHDVCDIKHAA